MEWGHGPCVVVRRLVEVGECIHEPNSLGDNTEIKRIANVDPEAIDPVRHSALNTFKKPSGDPGLGKVYNKSIGQAYQGKCADEARGAFSEVLLRDTEEEPDELAVGISPFVQGGDDRDELRSVGSSHRDPGVENTGNSVVRNAISSARGHKVIWGLWSIVCAHTYKSMISNYSVAYI